jgi:copper(I)-binding protein
MLMGLKQQVKEGDSVPVTLVIEGADGKRENVEVRAAARATNSSGGGHHQGGHRH